MITRMLKTLWQVERPGITTNSARCSHAIHQRSTCTRCVDACPTGALVFDEGLKLDVGRCRECGTCAAVCPTAALEARSPTDDQLLGEVRETSAARRPVTFACEPMRPESFGGQVISVPCLGRLDESILLAALALGAPAVHLLAAECHQCMFASARGVVERVVDRIDRLLAGSRYAGAIRFVDDLPLQDREPIQSAPGSSRRDFLRGIGREAGRVGTEAVYRQVAAEAAAQAGQPTAARPTPAPPEKRELLLPAWRRLGQPLPGNYDSSGLWAHVTVSEACNACEMCARFCPTGALRTVSQDAGADLRFTPAQCVDCGLCKDVCYLNAIEYDHAAGHDDLSVETHVMLYEGRRSPLVRADRDDRLANAIRETLKLF